MRGFGKSCHANTSTPQRPGKFFLTSDRSPPTAQEVPNCGFCLCFFEAGFNFGVLCPVGVAFVGSGRQGKRAWGRRARLEMRKQRWLCGAKAGAGNGKEWGVEAGLYEWVRFFIMNRVSSIILGLRMYHAMIPL